MSLGGVAAASVIDILLHAGPGLLPDLLAGNDSTAMGTGDEPTRIGELVRVVGGAAEQGLDSFPCLAVDERCLLAGIPLALEGDLSDVGTIDENRVQLAAREPWCVGQVHCALGVQPVAERIECEWLVRVEMEDPLDSFRSSLVDDRNAAAVLANVFVAVWCLADEPALLHAAGKPLFDIDGLLLGVEARHVGERASHHATCGCVLGGL
ncbi:MAG: hypothetical protein R3B58_03655 [Phycisphaerales bacterium]